MNKAKYLKIFGKNDWTIEDLNDIFTLIDKKAKEYLKLDIYPNQFEIVTFEQLLDVYSSVGLPMNYSHWKFGKEYMINHNKYLNGQMGLSYEMVINSNPCISYNLETNSLCLMTLVYAHAAHGHNSFFKNNYMFKQWTNAESIVDYMKFARNFISKCEEKYGPEEVEYFLDACHSIERYGTNSYIHPKISVAKEEQRMIQALKWEEERHDAVLDKMTNKKSRIFDEIDEDVMQQVLKEPQENILYFLEKYTPKLPKWKREIIRIIRKISQYFYPQMQTKVSNEGWATFCHYYIINRLYDEGFIPDSFMMEFMKHHTNVVYQPDFDSPHYYGLNPYTLGFNIFSDIKRICENPTDEDKEYFPHLIGKDWLEEMHFAMNNFRDDSFILQYLSPKVIRDMKLFTLHDNTQDKYEYVVKNIHDVAGYRKVREALSNQYNRDSYIPNVYVDNVNPKTRALMLKYNPKNGMELDDDSKWEVLDQVEEIWGFDVDIKQ